MPLPTGGTIDNQAYLVGEQGPEIFRPTTTGYVQSTMTSPTIQWGATGPMNMGTTTSQSFAANIVAKLEEHSKRNGGLNIKIK